MAKKATTKGVSENPLATLDFGDLDGAGFEGVDETHLKVPFLNLLQDMSDEVKEAHDNYVPGAKPGMLLNSVTKELFESVEFIPAMVDHCFVEWVPRKRGGGFVGRHDLNAPDVAAAKQAAQGSLSLRVSREDEDGNTNFNDLIETFYIAGVIVNGEEVSPCIIAATSTKISQYKEWMTRVNMFTIPKPGGGKQRPPLFAHRVTIASKPQSNTKGDFHNITITPVTDNDLSASLITNLESPLFLGGQKVRAMLGSGEAKIDYDSQAVGTAGGGATGSSDDDF